LAEEPDAEFLPGFTGRSVAVAVIDSGVHPGHDHIHRGRLGPGAMFLPDGALVEGDEAWLDRLGHGTAVTAAIQEKAPDATLLPARVFRDGLKASPAALIAAMRWAIARRVDLINLSLGTLNPAHRDAFAAVVDDAVAAGVVVVAAREANGEACYPGALEQVIGVEVDWDCPRETFSLEWRGAEAVFKASGHPRPIPGVPPRRNLYGVSFAVAQMTGFAARALQSLPMDTPRHVRLQQVRDLLIAG